MREVASVAALVMVLVKVLLVVAACDEDAVVSLES